MSGRLQKIQKENDEMKKELRNTKSKIEKLLRKFPSPQKVITREVDNGKLCFKIAVYMHNIFPCIGWSYPLTNCAFVLCIFCFCLYTL